MALNSKEQPIISRKIKQQELGAAGHTASAVRRQRAMSECMLLSSLLCLYILDQATGWCFA